MVKTFLPARQGRGVIARIARFLRNRKPLTESDPRIVHAKFSDLSVSITPKEGLEVSVSDVFGSQVHGRILKDSDNGCGGTQIILSGTVHLMVRKTEGKISAIRISLLGHGANATVFLGENGNVARIELEVSRDSINREHYEGKSAVDMMTLFFATASVKCDTVLSFPDFAERFAGAAAQK